MTNKPNEKGPRRWTAFEISDSTGPHSLIEHSREFVEASYYDVIEKDRDELKRALAIESNNPQDRSQEAAHYNWLDDQNAKLESALAVEKRKVEMLRDQRDDMVRIANQANGVSDLSELHIRELNEKLEAIERESET